MKLTDERVKDIADSVDFSQMVTADDYIYLIARAIEREAYRNGQEAMKKLAIYAIPINATPMEACAAIRALEIEEPK